MANAYTDITSGSSLGNYLVQTAYDRYVEFALRAVPMVRDVADKRPVQQAMPGSSVVFQIYTDLAQATTPLSETVDPDAVALGNTTPITVTLQEYGMHHLLPVSWNSSHSQMLTQQLLTSSRSIWLTLLTQLHCRPSQVDQT